LDKVKILCEEEFPIILNQTSLQPAEVIDRFNAEAETGGVGYVAGKTPDVL
jgi:hypothetical protein